MKFRFEWKKADDVSWKRLEVEAECIESALLALRSFIVNGLCAYFDQVVVNHVFMELGDYPEDIVSHSLTDFSTEFSIECGGTVYGPGAVLPIPAGVEYSE